MEEQLVAPLGEAIAAADAAAAEDARRAKRFAEFEDRGYDTVDIVDSATDEGNRQLWRSLSDASRWFGWFGLSDIIVLPVPAVVAEECGYDPSPSLKAVVAYDPGLAA